MSNGKYTVGQTVWFERDDKRWSTGEYVEIVKVGRQYYTTTQGYKFLIENNYQNTYPQGRLYNTEQDAKDHVKAQNMFWALKGMYNINPTLEQMKAIYKILELEVKEDE